MISNDKQWYVYIHTNKINNKKYIGITSQVPEERWGENGINYSGQSKFYNAIQQYGWENFSHEIVDSNLTKTSALEKEANLIIQYNSVKNGYNSQTGLTSDEELYSKEVYCLETGEIYPSVASAARAKAIDACHLSNHLHGKKAQTIFGYHWYFLDDQFNQEHYEADKIAQEKLDIKNNRDKLFAKLYEEGKTQREIAEITGSSKETISAALKRQNITIKSRRIKVIALDKNTNQIVKEFDSMREACEWVGIDKNETSRIRQAIIESWRECKGYKWTTTNEKLLTQRAINKTQYSVNNPPIEAMAEDYKNGLTIAQLVDKYGFCDISIGKWLKQFGITLSAGGKQAIVQIDPDTNQIVAEFDSMNSIYKMWNMNPNNPTLGKRCKDHKIYHNAIWYYKEDYEKLLTTD